MVESYLHLMSHPIDLAVEFIQTSFHLHLTFSFAKEENLNMETIYIDIIDAESHNLKGLNWRTFLCERNWNVDLRTMSLNTFAKFHDLQESVCLEWNVGANVCGICYYAGSFSWKCLISLDESWTAELTHEISLRRILGL